MVDAQDVIVRLGLRPHPEGGWYRRTWVDPNDDGGRGRGSAIVFLLAAGEVSHWHRIDATEIWHRLAGEALELTTWVDGSSSTRPARLGPTVTDGDVAQVVVPPYVWQTARTLGSWTLCGCVVVPEFTFEGFELAPAGWVPPIDRA